MGNGVPGGPGRAPRRGRRIRDRRTRRGEDQGPTVVGPQGGLDVHGGDPGGRAALLLGGGHGGGPVVAGLGVAAGVGCARRRSSTAGPGRRRRLDPDVVRGPGYPLQGDDPLPVAPAETLLWIDEFGGGPQGSTACVRGGIAGTSMERR